MKTKILLIALVVVLACTPLFFGYSNPVHKVSPPVRWKNLGNIVTSTTTPAVGARDSSTMVLLASATTIAMSHAISWVMPNDIGKVELRFSTPAPTNDHTLEFWLARGATMANGSTEDHFMKAFALEITTGSQTGPYSNFFVDAIVETEDNWSATSTAYASGTSIMGLYEIGGLKGWSEMIILGTTIQVAATPVYIDAAWYSE